ncbi:hypothetical protein QS257_06800 [Terrilactibacillus sp. S3-3]|nr:hypothetical protein QS257_06800 [Terrilactibacillus sp. S3-3]
MSRKDRKSFSGCILMAAMPFFLEKQLVVEKQKQLAATDLQKQRSGFIKQDQAAGEKLARYKEECRKILALAGTEDAESFFAAAKAAERLKDDAKNWLKELSRCAK